MMPCPRCGSTDTIVLRTRGDRARVRWIDGAGWRLHECVECHHKYASIQRAPSVDELESAETAAGE